VEQIERVADRAEPQQDRQRQPRSIMQRDEAGDRCPTGERDAERRRQREAVIGLLREDRHHGQGDQRQCRRAQPCSARALFRREPHQRAGEQEREVRAEIDDWRAAQHHAHQRQRRATEPEHEYRTCPPQLPRREQRRT